VVIEKNSPANTGAIPFKNTPTFLQRGGATMTLAELREAKGLTVEELAKELKVSRMAVYFWEAGNTMPTAKNLRKLAEFYELSMEEMLGVLEATKKLYNEVFL